MGCSLRLGEGDQFVSHVLILQNFTASAHVHLCKPVKIIQLKDDMLHKGIYGKHAALLEMDLSAAFNVF